MGMHIEFWWKIQKVRDCYEDQGVGGWALLKMEWVDVDLIDLEGSSECSDEPLVSITLE
jgi:hypothetical protein